MNEDLTDNLSEDAVTGEDGASPSKATDRAEAEPSARTREAPGDQPSRPPTGNRWQALDSALRDFAHAIKSMQLYPEGSPVVDEALDDALEGLRTVVGATTLVVDILPTGMRVESETIGEGSPTIQQLASRLHHRGVARLIIDSDVEKASLRRLAKLVATDRGELDERGGFDVVLEEHSLPGIKAEFLELQRLFEAARGRSRQLEVETVWDTLLTGFEENSDLDELSWEDLATDENRLGRFLHWMLDHSAENSDLAAYSQVDLLRLVCERIGEISTELGDDYLDYLILSVGGLYDRLDPEAWIELLAEPLILEDRSEPDGGAASPPVSAIDAVRDEDFPPDQRAGMQRSSLDLTGRVAAALDATEVEELLVYTVRTRKGPNPRLLRMFRRVLGPRPDGRQIAKSVSSLARAGAVSSSSGERAVSLENWGDLNDVLLGEEIDPHVTAGYRSTMETLWEGSPSSELWPMERIRPRKSELRADFLVRRECRVLNAILEDEYEDRDYLRLAKRLQNALPELLAQEEYALIEEIIGRFARDRLPESGRSKQQRRLADRILRDFATEERIVGIVRKLIGKPESRVERVTRLFRHLGTFAVVGLLNGLAKERSRQTRSLMLRMLTALGDRALPEIEKHLRDQRWFFVRNLVWIIGEVGEPEYAHHLSGPATPPDPRVRKETVRALAKIGGEAASRILLGMLDDDEEGVRLVAIRGLGHCGSPRAADRLRGLLQLPNWRGQNTETIKAAAIALGRLGDDGATEDLARLARRPWIFRRRRRPATEGARWALRALTGEANTTSPDDLGETSDPPVTETSDGDAEDPAAANDR